LLADRYAAEAVFAPATKSAFTVATLLITWHTRALPGLHGVYSNCLKKCSQISGANSRRSMTSLKVTFSLCCLSFSPPSLFFLVFC